MLTHFSLVDFYFCHQHHLHEFIYKSDELINKINFIKNILENNKLRKNISNNSHLIIQKLNKTIEIIDETVINNCLIQTV